MLDGGEGYEYNVIASQIPPPSSPHCLDAPYLPVCATSCGLTALILVLISMTGPSSFAPNYGPGSPVPLSTSSSFTIYGAALPPPGPHGCSPAQTRRDIQPDNTGLMPPPRCNCTHSRPISQAPAVILTPPTPAQPILAPPSYATPSPPKYAIVAADTETALLLAPPPSFEESTRCSRCIEDVSQFCRCQPGKVDWIVRALVVLNLIVWGAVLRGYISQRNEPGGINWNGRGDIIPGYRGFWADTPALQSNSAGCAFVNNAGEDCRWVFANC